MAPERAPGPSPEPSSGTDGSPPAGGAPSLHDAGHPAGDTAGAAGHGTLGWPGRIAVAVVRGDPTEVFLAESDATLGHLLALRLVCATPAAELEPSGLLGEIRQALADARWGDAVELWMAATGEVVDAYPDEPVVTAEQLAAEGGPAAVRSAPVFGGVPDDDLVVEAPPVAGGGPEG